MDEWAMDAIRLLSLSFADVVVLFTGGNKKFEQFSSHSRRHRVRVHTPSSHL